MNSSFSKMSLSRSLAHLNENLGNYYLMSQYDLIMNDYNYFFYENNWFCSK